MYICVYIYTYIHTYICTYFNDRTDTLDDTINKYFNYIDHVVLHFFVCLSFDFVVKEQYARKPYLAVSTHWVSVQRNYFTVFIYQALLFFSPLYLPAFAQARSPLPLFHYYKVLYRRISSSRKFILLVFYIIAKLSSTSSPPPPLPPVYN